MFNHWKKIAGMIFIMLFISSSAFAQQAFIDGVHYKTITPAASTTQPDKVVVTEVFWYGCPHCYRFEPYIEKWAKNIPQGVAFEQVPSVINPRWSDHARAYYAMKMMGIQHALHAKLFNAIHLERKRINSEDTLAAFVAANGYDESKFRELYSSFPVDTQLRKNMKQERRYGHNGVPAVIINGKYLTSGSMAGSNAALIQVIQFLVDKELQNSQG